MIFCFSAFLTVFLAQNEAIAFFEDKWEVSFSLRPSPKRFILIRISIFLVKH